MYGSLHPLWPLDTPPKDWTKMGSFGTRRPGWDTFTRHHQGVDLYAPVGATVRACEDGVVVAHQGWSGPGTKAIFVESDGVLLLYGAVAPKSYPAIGTVVTRGQKIAEVGVYPQGSSMLHIEAWKRGVRPTRPAWDANDPQPDELHNVEEYLERCRATPQAPAPTIGEFGFWGLALAAIGLGFLARRRR